MKTSCKVSLSAGLILAGLASFALAEDKPGLAVPASAQKTPTSGSPKTSSSAAEFRVIGYLEKREQTITIKSGAKGPVYSVKTTDGKVLFENVSAEQLQAKAPELHEFLKSAMAGNGVVKDAKARIKMDASVSLAR